MPLDIAMCAPFARVDPIMYVPAPLHPCALGWHPEWSKCWQGWGPAHEPKWAPEARVQAIKARAKAFKEAQKAVHFREEDEGAQQGDKAL